jgi:D-arabinose 1-dehydrogenase-like Zn-dependent alcohol dehydrogenase
LSGGAQARGADVAVALAVSPRACEQVCVALPADDEMSVSTFDTVLSGESIIGSIVGTKQDLAEVFALHAAGRTEVIAESYARRGQRLLRGHLGGTGSGAPGA